MRTELLAPAGSPEALMAAVQAGADAVYLGLGPFNARRNAKNFTPETLPDQVAYCRQRGAKVYLTLNTLVTDRELPQAAETAAQAARAGVDAILVQDLGVARLLRETCPDVALHASTQMTVHDLDGVKACADLGMTRVVLSRELSASAIRTICQRSPVEVEVFAHGALCMCYSGQCWLSAVLGGRSGNRGLCAQPCRLAFRWPGDKGESRPLSLKDLSLVRQLRELEEMGVACLKIEGRMKRPEYVWVVTSVYAAALREGREPTAEEVRRLEAAFSRQGFTQGYYNDRKGPAMFGWRKEGTKDPEDLFREARQTYGRGEHRLTPVTFAARVKAEQPVTLTVRDDAGHTADAVGEPPQQAVNRPVTAEQIANQLRKTGGTVYRLALRQLGSREDAEDAAQEVFLKAYTGVQSFRGDSKLSVWLYRITRNVCIDLLRRRRETVSLSVETEDGLALPLSAVNALRREALAKLDEARTAIPPRRVLPYVPPNTVKNPGEPPAFSLSFRRWSQVSPACLDQGPALVYLPAEEYAACGAEIKETIAAWPAVRFGVTFPRVSWDRERPALEEALSAARKAGATEALLGHIGQLPLARQYSLTPRGDFGLGWLNSLTGAELARLGFASATASFEARLSQLRDLDKALDLELLVYGRLPLMLTENCILKNRGKGCHCHEGPQVLRDRKGEEFPVEQAWGCRNELFNAKVLWLADKAPDWQRIGARYARLSFLEEDRAACAGVFEAYRTGRGEAPGAFTRGLYYRGVE